MCIYIYGKIDQSFFLHFLCLWRAWLLCNREVSLQRNRNDVIEQDWILSSSFLLTKFFFFFFFFEQSLLVNYSLFPFFFSFSMLIIINVGLSATLGFNYCNCCCFNYDTQFLFSLRFLSIFFEILTWMLFTFCGFWTGRVFFRVCGGKNRENGISISISISVSVSTSIWVVYSGK